MRHAPDPKSRETLQCDRKQYRELRAFNQRISAVKARIDETGKRLPKGTYRSAAQHHYAIEEARRTRHPREHLGHPLTPYGEGNLLIGTCTREGCAKTFVTNARQRRFCSRACAQLDQRSQSAAKRARYEATTVACARTGCTERFFQLRPDHLYCSATCRDRSRRRGRVAHTSRQCDSCGHTFTPKNVRARFCSDRCRVRKWSQIQADMNADTQPVPVQHSRQAPLPTHGLKP